MLYVLVARDVDVVPSFNSRFLPVADPEGFPIPPGSLPALVASPPVDGGPARGVERFNAHEARLRRPEICPVVLSQDQRLFSAILGEPADYDRLS